MVFEFFQGIAVRHPHGSLDESEPSERFLYPVLFEEFLHLVEHRMQMGHAVEIACGMEMVGKFFLGSSAALEFSAVEFNNVSYFSLVDSLHLKALINVPLIIAKEGRITEIKIPPPVGGGILLRPSLSLYRLRLGGLSP